MARPAGERGEAPPAKTPAQRAVARIGWLLALIALIGLIAKPSTPWIFLWVPMLTFGLAKAPQDLRDAWRRWRAARQPGQ